MAALRHVLTIAAALVLTGLWGGVSIAAPSVPWAMKAGGTSTDIGRGVSTFSDGSAVVTGEFMNIAVFGSTTLISAGSNDVFVAKVDASGAYEWATRVGGRSVDIGRGVSTLPDGSAIVTGQFQETAIFGSTTLRSAGSYDVFVAKIDASGAYEWATKAGGPSVDRGYAVSSLSDGSAIVTGQFQDTAIFGSTTLTSAGNDDVFVAKIDASGAFEWATRVGGPSADSGRGVSTFSDGSAVVTGFFRNTSTFGSTTLRSAGNSDVFVAKVDASGAYEWATKAGGLDGDAGNAVSTFSDGSAIVTGQFRDTAIFGSTTLTSAGSNDVFVAKVDASGAYEWATRVGDTSSDVGYALSSLSDGSAVVTGKFQDTATFGSTTFTSAGGEDVFVAKIDASGAYEWARKAGGTSGDDVGRGVGTLCDGSAVVTGDFQNTAIFGSTTLTSAGNYDVFVAKMETPAECASADPAPADPAPADSCAALTGIAKVTCEADATRNRTIAGARVTRGSARAACATKKTKAQRALCTKSANATYTQDVKRANAIRARTISRYRCGQMTGAKKRVCAAKANATYTRTLRIASALRARTIARQRCTTRPRAARKLCNVTANATYTRTVAIQKARRARTIARARCATKAKRTRAACTRTANRRYAKAVKRADATRAAAIARAK